VRISAAWYEEVIAKMTIAQLISLAIAISIVLTVFALGLNANLEDAIWLFRRPGLLVRSILSMNVLMVVLAIIVAKVFNLDPVIETAIIALAISPVPPIFPKKQQKVGATDSYAVALLVSASLASVILIPGWIELLGGIFSFEAHLGLGKILPIIFLKILLPLFAGILVHRFAPHFARRAARPISLIAMVLLVIGVLPVLFISYRAMWAMVGNGVLVAVILFAVVGITAGHLLGGPDPDDRSVLALATSTRHPGLAITIAALNFPERKGAVLIVVLFHLIIGTIVAIPYIKWRKSLHFNLEAKERA
jgi:BASS family bile acid:Na+ symporter